MTTAPIVAMERAAAAAHAASGAASRIGPNAVLQVVAELRQRWGEGFAETILYSATGRNLAALPHEMVDEREVMRLVARVLETLGREVGRAVLHAAGARTAEYLLAHRIPRSAQRLLRLLPARLAFPLLGRAMAAHAWTFAGSGVFSYRRRGAGELSIRGCPMCRGHRAEGVLCDFYAGTFARLVRELVSAEMQVREVTCEAAGASACTFRLVPR